MYRGYLTEFDTWCIIILVRDRITVSNHKIKFSVWGGYFNPSH